jgi:hypothetical protein
VVIDIGVNELTSVSATADLTHSCTIILAVDGIQMGTSSLQDNTYLSIIVFSSLFLLFVDVVAMYACGMHVYICVTGRAMPHYMGVPYGMQCAGIKQAEYQSQYTHN